jgi:hypothetical protein
MAFVTADRVRDTSTTAGSGSFSVSGTAPTGYRTFSAVLSVSDTFYYSIQHQTLNEWEVGLGTYSSANTFARTTIYSSSNAGSAVTFSAGTKDVFITMAAARSLQLDASGNVTPAINGTLAWQSVQTGNFTAVAGNAYPVNTTSGAVTVTLPASPTAGQVIQIVDYAGTWATKAVTINPNGGKINNSTSNVFLATNRASIALIYIDATQGWTTYSGFNASTPVSTYSALYLVAAGGGGGGGMGGGGAGGYQTSTLTLTPGTSYTATIGAGGAAAATTGVGATGSNSVFSSVTSTGGGGGGAFTSTPNGVAGGSGGGGAPSSVSPNTGGIGGAGTAGQGNSGSFGITGGTAGGGGGGAGTSGIAGLGNYAGAGGAGLSSAITGTSTYYAGGGGGGGNSFVASVTGAGGAGGYGGGGTGATMVSSGVFNPVATAGAANTGGGGGGGYTANAAAGGSGVVILSVPTANYSGTTTGSPTVTTSGSNTIIKFTASGSYTA